MASRILVDGVEIATADAQPTFWAKLAAGTWESGTRAAIRRLARPGTLFVDIGAWVGPTALLAAGHGADVIAFEPDPVARAQLETNLAVNPALARRITVRQEALAGATGGGAMRAARKPGDSMSSLVAGKGESWQVATLSPSGLAALLRSDLPRILKVDIEGGEYSAFAAADAAVLTRAPTRAAIVSFHPGSVTGGRALVEAATRRVFAAFDGFAHTLLDAAAGEGGDDALGRACVKNTTVLFERP